MIPVYVGYDPREAVGFHVFCSSLIRHSSAPVSIAPLARNLLGTIFPPQSDGSNDFIYSRFLVPYLQRFDGWAIFVDGSDMLCMKDIAQLWALRDESKSVLVVKHDYRTRHKVKYRGTDMECPNPDYPRKNWSSVMLMNCAHPDWRLTPETLSRMTGSQLHRFSWINDECIGALPAEWNYLVSEQQGIKPALAHFTVGIPHFSAYRDVEHADQWRDELDIVNNA